MFVIDQRSHKSICDQIVDNYKEFIVCGVLKTDEKLPSVRDLSRDLMVNPNTVQKAYKQLEEQKYIYVAKGRGTFVSDEFENIIDENRKAEALTVLEDSINSLYYMGLKVSEIFELVKEILERRKQ